MIASLTFPSILHVPAASHPSVNVNAQILQFYVDKIAPALTGGKRRLEDDGNYGSAATRDVEVLQALSRRIHFGQPSSLSPDQRHPSKGTPKAHTLPAGMFVSESKFLSSPADFIPHILAQPPNTDALTALIYKPEVEARLLVRLANKARVYGGEYDADGRVVEAKEGVGKINIEDVVGMYRDYVIPLTKDVEVGAPSIAAAVADTNKVDYLIHRLDEVPQSQIDAWMAGTK